jgi:superfamily II DNA/RNA helicase
LTRKKIARLSASGNEEKEQIKETDDSGEAVPQLIFATATLTKAVKALLEEMSTGKPTTVSTLSSASSSDDYNKIAVFDADFADPDNLAAKRRKQQQQVDPEDVPLAESTTRRVRMKVVQVDGLHRGLSNIKYNYQEIDGQDDKLDRLLQLLPQPSSSKASNQSKKILIFANTVASCRAVHHRLAELYPSSQTAVKLFAYHGDMTSVDRREQLDAYRTPIDPAHKASHIMVCTDIAARGIDIPDVEHVILFDFPLNPIDFLHRSGRCGRMGKAGKVTSLLGKRDLVLAKAIQAAMAKGLPLDSLSSSKRDYQDSGKLAEVVGKLSRSEMLARQKKKSIHAAAVAKKNKTPAGTGGAGSSQVGGRRSRGRVVPTGKPSPAARSSAPSVASSSAAGAKTTFVGRGIGRSSSSSPVGVAGSRSSKPSGRPMDRENDGSSYSKSSSRSRSGSSTRSPGKFSVKMKK